MTYICAHFYDKYCLVQFDDLDIRTRLSEGFRQIDVSPLNLVDITDRCRAFGNQARQDKGGSAPLIGRQIITTL